MAMAAAEKQRKARGMDVHCMLMRLEYDFNRRMIRALVAKRT
jgi:hypothetical protein